ncbi:LacI family DNA-binding transcriptional regulator [Clostridium felsineum]|uniref:HTH-type transcriptional repressor PurR n=1 Tax=Clostridium felsineum TaxID=36839 RepID=A0A1S8L647_9CLOT|nr:LacI family DNA-binding transcriptional regulator [Clostridium felsineum]URZ06628.1 HTH-type transcriptional repressor PurR [Clostridium felsineum]URZ11661.1 HTH-type transcriptional repressor PurR [Clostridium felsineum]
MKTIMQDIAKLAGVSPGTVSNALNNRKGVGQETKAKIIKIAEELGYFSTRRKSEEKVIRLIIFKKHGYVVSDTQFFTSLIGACEDQCRQNGYELLISQVIDGEHSKDDITSIIDQRKVDGVLLLATEMDEMDFEKFNNLDIPMVVLDNYFDNKSNDYILINNITGAFRATKYLIENCHKRIGMMGSSIDINNFKHRKMGFEKAINESGILLKKEDNILLEPTLNGSYLDMKKYLEVHNKKDLPTAFFAFNDIIALGAIKAMIENGIKIPEDVSIIGFDDIEISSVISPSMTTIKVYTTEMGVLAVRRLINKIDEVERLVPIKIEIDTDLIERNSVVKL